MSARRAANAARPARPPRAPQPLRRRHWASARTVQAHWRRGCAWPRPPRLGGSAGGAASETKEHHGHPAEVSHVISVPHYLCLRRVALCLLGGGKALIFPTVGHMDRGIGGGTALRGIRRTPRTTGCAKVVAVQEEERPSRERPARVLSSPSHQDPRSRPAQQLGRVGRSNTARRHAGTAGSTPPSAACSGSAGPICRARRPDNRGRGPPGARPRLPAVRERVPCEGAGAMRWPPLAAGCQGCRVANTRACALAAVRPGRGLLAIVPPAACPPARPPMPTPTRCPSFHAPL